MKKKLTDREQKICNRLYELYHEYLDKQNKRIDQKNTEIKEDNQKRLEEWKKKIQRGPKPTPRKEEDKYTQTRFMDDFEDKYGKNLDKSKLSKYLNGSVCPPEEMLRCFCDLFQVSYDYMVGRSIVRNVDTARLSDFLNLNDDALGTLLSFNGNSELTRILNAFLSDRETAAYILMNMYEHAYRTYSRKNHPDSFGSYDESIMLDNISHALSLSNYIDNVLESYFADELQSRLQEDMDYESWRSGHFDEYCADIPNEQNYISDSASVSATPAEEKDSQ